MAKRPDQRKAKKGHVYLLAFKDDIEDITHYKYGCTTLTPEARCKRVRRESREPRNEVVASKESSDAYGCEHKIRMDLLAVWVRYAV